MSGIATVGIEHNFETAHRLPFLGGKCANLHGHSWKVRIFFCAWQLDEGMNAEGISTEYGLLKQDVRGWIDDKLDHGCMLGVKDPLLPVLLAEDSKVFAFGDVGFLHIAAEEEGRTSYNLPAVDRNYPDLPWPTVEATARMVAEKIQELVDRIFNKSLRVEAVEIRETTTNTSLWIPDAGVVEPSDGMSASAAALRGEDVHP
jgi:6-pyruvoyltetrahydropterin/6-carboxytetrahydropterin synthase